MKSVKRRKLNRARVPFTLRPRKKYPFRTPIPPCSIVRVKAAPRNPWRKEVGRCFRIGYYSWQDGIAFGLSTTMASMSKRWTMIICTNSLR
jgi:hypothetical protein